MTTHTATDTPPESILIPTRTTMPTSTSVSTGTYQASHIACYIAQSSLNLEPEHAINDAHHDNWKSAGIYVTGQLRCFNDSGNVIIYC